MGPFDLNCYTSGYICNDKIKHIENSFMFSQLIRDPTRVTLTSCSLTDLIFTSEHLNISLLCLLPLQELRHLY